MGGWKWGNYGNVDLWAGFERGGEGDHFGVSFVRIGHIWEAVGGGMGYNKMDSTPWQLSSVVLSFTWFRWFRW